VTVILEYIDLLASQGAVIAVLLCMQIAEKFGFSDNEGTNLCLLC